MKKIKTVLALIFVVVVQITNRAFNVPLLWRKQDAFKAFADPTKTTIIQEVIVTAFIVTWLFTQWHWVLIICYLFHILQDFYNFAKKFQQ